jgi:hypothetical protein
MVMNKYAVVICEFISAPMNTKAYRQGARCVCFFGDELATATNSRSKNLENDTDTHIARIEYFRCPRKTMLRGRSRIGHLTEPCPIPPTDHIHPKAIKLEHEAREIHVKKRTGRSRRQLGSIIVELGVVDHVVVLRVDDDGTGSGGGRRCVLDLRHGCLALFCVVVLLLGSIWRLCSRRVTKKRIHVMWKTTAVLLYVASSRRHFPASFSSDHIIIMYRI